LKEAVMSYHDVAPIHSARGVMTLPGSKSISNRVLLLSALASGDTEVHGLLHAEDTEVMLSALTQLGIGIALVEGSVDGLDRRVSGAAGIFPVKQASLFLGNAGTAFRSLTAALAVSAGRYQLSGVPRMHERPIGDLVDALRMLGARVDYLDKPGYPPLTIEPFPIAAGQVAYITRVRGNVSSQFLSGLLMAMPLLLATAAQGATGKIVVEGELISRPYVEITLNLMQRFGVTVERHGWNEFIVPAGQRYLSPGTIQVEGDASSASYFLALGAIAGGPVRVLGVGQGSIQGDVHFTRTLREMGARVEMDDHSITVTGVHADRGERLKAINADFNDIPDAAMTAAILALFADGPSRLRNIGSWRVKETDRIHAMATELRKVGATVRSGDDFLEIQPPAEFRTATIDTYDDHRMAMCFSLVSCAGVKIRINNPECVAKTFPDYFQVLAGLLHG